MATRKLVHKQFNSPIGLYSNQNVKETLDRELKTLNNGAVGIDFDDPSTTRTGNLAKSAVLAALEEEEREKQVRKSGGLTRVAWPPNLDSAPHAPAAVGIRAVEIQPEVQAPQYVAPPQNKVHEPQYVDVNEKFVAPQQPRPELKIAHNIHNQNFAKPLSPLAQLETSPSVQPHSPIYGSPRGWSHVNPPNRPLSGNYFQNMNAVAPSFEAKDSTVRCNQAQTHNIYAQSGVSVENQQPFVHGAPVNNTQHYEAPVNNSQYYEAPPSNVPHHVAPPSHIQQQQLPFRGSPLRKEAPVTQKPAPVYSSQPIASSFQGGKNSRGDSKWPPQEYKMQSEIDNEARRQLALGPVFRPKRVQKDYTGFFAQNALTTTYPGYRVPPVLQNMH